MAELCAVNRMNCMVGLEVTEGEFSLKALQSDAETSETTGKKESSQPLHNSFIKGTKKTYDDNNKVLEERKSDFQNCHSIWFKMTSLQKKKNYDPCKKPGNYGPYTRKR